MENSKNLLKKVVDLLNFKIECIFPMTYICRGVPRSNSIDFQWPYRVGGV